MRWLPVLLLPLAGCTITRVTQTAEPMECLQIIPSPDHWHPSGSYEVALVSGDTLRPDFGDLVWGRDSTVWMRYDFGHPWLESDHSSIAEPASTASVVVRRHAYPWGFRLSVGGLLGGIGMLTAMYLAEERDPEPDAVGYSYGAVLGASAVGGAVGIVAASAPRWEDRCEIVR